jgi:hypothetical protein
MSFPYQQEMHTQEFLGVPTGINPDDQIWQDLSAVMISVIEIYLAQHD